MWYCSSCLLGQTGETVEPKDIFSEYHYQTSASAPLIRHLSALAKTIQTYKPFSVLDIGCNDGTLLSFFAKTGVRILGVEPAKNIATLARRRGIPVIADFFGEKLARSIRKTYGMFDVITVTHTLANIPDLPDFFRGIKMLLHPKGTLIIEVASFEDMCKTGAIDSVYHEHYWYFSRHSLRYVLEDAGFSVQRIQHTTSQGGSLQVFAKINGVRRVHGRPKTPVIETDRTRRRLLDALRRFRGKTVAGFGAPAKSVTLLNWLQLSNKDIAFIVDATQEKQGRVIPGTAIPVYPEEYLLGKHVDAVIIFSWNYRSEILRKLSRLVPRGTPIIIPFPTLTVVMSS